MSGKLEADELATSQGHWPEAESDDSPPTDDDRRNIEALEAWFHDAWLKGDVSAADQVFANDVVVETEGGIGLGRDAVVAGAVELHSALSEMTGQVEVLGAGGRYIVSYRLIARHEKDLFGLPRTGSFIELSGVVSVWFARGLAQRVWQTCGVKALDAEAPTASLHGSWVSEWGVTPREASVARLVMAGLSNQEVATRLGLALASVNKYVQRVLRKANAPSRTELSLRAKTIELG